MVFDIFVLRIPIFGNDHPQKNPRYLLRVPFVPAVRRNRHQPGAPHRSKSGMGNASYEREIDAMLADVKSGKPLSSSMGGEYTERKIRGEAISGKRRKRVPSKDRMLSLSNFPRP
jgi:hypothetical protein